MFAAIKNFFKVILYKPLFNLLLFFAWLVPGHSVGWAIIIVTFLVRLALWPSSLKTLKAPLQMRQYAPELKAIQEKYKDDRQAQSQAQMAFYKEKGINPLAGCLPLLIQLPILLIMYRVFITGLNSIRPDLLYSFTPHLATINSIFFGINLLHPDKFWILPLLAGGAQYFQTRSMQAINPAAANSNDPTAMMNKQMMYLFPLMTFFIARSLPSGLALYWFVTSIFSLGQQVYVAKTYKPAKATASVSVRSKKKG